MSTMALPACRLVTVGNCMVGAVCIAVWTNHKCPCYEVGGGGGGGGSIHMQVYSA